MAEPYLSMIERLTQVLRSLTLTNILMFALLLVLVVPAYFAYRFLSDEQFRGEFMQGAKLLDKHVPCVVLEAHAYGRSVRHSVIVIYELDGRYERLIGMRAPGKWSDEELSTVCQVVLNEAAHVSRLKDAAKPPEPKP